MTRYVAAIDQGTTSSRCIIFNERFQIVSEHQVEHRQITPQPGWLEHDAEEIYRNTCVCIATAVKKLRERTKKAVKIDAIGITNQRETSVAWDRTTGKPLCHAIVWSDARTYEVQKKITDTVGGGDPNFAASVNGLPTSTPEHSGLRAAPCDVRRPSTRCHLRTVAHRAPYTSAEHCSYHFFHC